ncbi:hypothetical protein J437_LFUL016422 [Ladona fulva]|uniref:Caspase family p20 domain-containing protein n=1 Tax=Ladona fulva TaxID=123851 RepID=A0A8K0PC33_LADFU|nr:hypothetical protein J437_LFUL016422 [Ladona fulva]
MKCLIEDYNQSMAEETKADQLYYKMGGNKKAIIINMFKFKNPAKMRNGAEKDVESLVETFRHLRFEIVKLEDCHRQDLMDELDKREGLVAPLHLIGPLLQSRGWSWVGLLADPPKNQLEYILEHLRSSMLSHTVAAADYKDCDCLAVIIMTHGHNDTLYCIDDRTFTLKEVEEKFLPGNCPELAGKPKLFFIQACRGSDIIKAYKAFDARKEEITETQHLIPKSCDVLEFFSTEEGTFCRDCVCKYR